MLKQLAMPKEQTVTLSSLSLLRGPALKIQGHPLTIRYKHQSTGKNFAFTHFPLWTMMKSNVFTPNIPYCKKKKLLWASFMWWPSSPSGPWALMHVLSAAELQREAWDGLTAPPLLILLLSVWVRGADHALCRQCSTWR